MALSNVLLQNISNPLVSSPAGSFREGQKEETARKAQITTDAMAKSNLVGKNLANVAQKEANRVAPAANETKQKVSDANLEKLTNGLNEEELKIVMRSAQLLKTIKDPIERAPIIAGMKAAVKNNNIASGVVGMLANPNLSVKQTDNILAEFDDLAVRFEYMKGKEVLSATNETELTSYVRRANEQKMLEQKEAGEPVTGLTPGEKNVAFLEAKRAQEQERFNTAFGSGQGTKTSDLSPKGDELRDVEKKDAANTAFDVDTSKATVKTINDIHDSIGTTQSTIENLTGIEEAIDDGAITGWASKFAPSLRAATLKLQNHAHRLGLDVIASVTFGALSEAELRLAMETAVPTDMAPQDLKKWIIAKKAAMKKFLKEQQKMVIFLENKNEETGVRNTRTDWLRKNESLKAEAEAKGDNAEKTYDTPLKAHIDYYYNNPKNLSKKDMDRFFKDKFGFIPEVRGAI